MPGYRVVSSTFLSWFVSSRLATHRVNPSLDVTGSGPPTAPSLRTIHGTRKASATTSSTSPRPRPANAGRSPAAGGAGPVGRSEADDEGTDDGRQHGDRDARRAAEDRHPPGGPT